MEPAQSIIDKLGGPAAVAAMAKVHRTRPYGWLKTGIIPLQHIPKLVAAARAKRIKLSTDDFMPREAA